MVQKTSIPKTDREKTTPSSAKLLMINYYCPPVKAVGAVRVANLYRHARDYFGQVHMLTTSNQSIFQQEEASLVYESVDYIPTLDFRRILRFFRKNVTYFSSQKKKHPIKKLLIRLIDSFPLNLLIGDGGLLYILAGYRKACQLVKEEGITHVFSSFRPYSDHAIAYLLKRRFPHLYWIADFRDVQVDPNRKNVLFPGFQHGCNREILKKADLLTSVSKGYTRYLSRYNDQAFCLYNGIEVGNDQPEDQPPFSKFTLAYTGTVYPELQDPGILLEALRELITEGKIPEEKVQLVLAGRDGEVWQDWIDQHDLSGLLKNMGTLSRVEALQIQRRSHINLLLSWSSSELQGVLTGKLYEYLQHGHPILAVVNGVRDEEFEELFDRFQAGLIAYDRPTDLEKVKDFILDAFLEWKKSGKVTSRLKRKEMEAFYWPSLMQTLINRIGLMETSAVNQDGTGR
jgi:hypothetical protein